MCRSLFAALIGYLLTADDCQQLAFLHGLPEIDRYRLDNTRNAWHQVSRTILIETHFAGERQAEADVLRPRLHQLNAGCGDLFGTQRQVPFFAFGMSTVSGRAVFSVIRMVRRFIGMGVDG
ncbi:hypothetical protein D3C84_278450 [compost metagenome]